MASEIWSVCKICRVNISADESLWVQGPVILIQTGVKQMVSIADPFIAHEVLGTKGSLAANRPYDKFMTKIYSSNGRFVKV